MDILQFIFSIVTALGLLEVVKKLINDWYENSVIRKANEIRLIASEVLDKAIELKNRDYSPPMSEEERKQFLSYAHKADEYDKRLGGAISILVNWPTIAETIKNNASRQQEGTEVWSRNMNRLRNDVDSLINTCRTLRFSPAIKILWDAHNNKQYKHKQVA